MKYSVMNWIYGTEPLEKTLERLSRLRYDGISLKGEPDQYNPSRVRELVREYGLEVASIDGIYPWPTEERDLCNPDERVRKRAVEYVKKCIDFAFAVNAPLVVVVPSPVGKNRPLAPKEKEWEWAVESVREVAEYALRKGIEIAVEPINRYETHLLNTCEQALEFVKEVAVENAKIMLDCFHMNIEEADPAAAVRRAGKMFIHMHVADSNRQSVGRGHTDFKSIMRSLKEIGYERYLAMEPLPPLADPYDALTKMVCPELFDLYAEECINNLKAIERVL
jgi:sugar phosphate isomerase/epimerase